MQGLVVDATWDPKPDYTPTADELRRRRAIIGSSVWRHPTWSVAERPEPKITGPNDVLIRTRAVGICGSDVHLYETDDDGYLLLAYRMSLPVAIGHEFSGEVVEVGVNVTRVRVGDPVAVEAMSYCGSCAACQRGLHNLCEKGEDLGLTHDGGTAQLVVAPERHCWSLTGVRDRVGDSLVYDIGALVEPTSIAFNGMFGHAGGFRPGDHVAVFGLGPVGLAAVALARACGAGRVIGIDTQASRRDLAETMGADATIDPADSLAGNFILQRTGGAGAGMVVDASGFSGATMPDIERALAYGGKVVMLGINAGRVPIDTVALQMKGAHLFSALGHLGGGFPAVIELHRAGRLDMSQVVTGRFNLRDGVEAVRRLSHRQDAKVLIYPNNEPTQGGLGQSTDQLAKESSWT